MEYSQLIGKKVISIYESAIDSYVINVLVNKKYKINKLVLVDKDENYKLLLPKDIFCVKDSILIRNSAKTIVCNIEQTQNMFINKEVFGISGQYYGIVKNMEIDNWSITKIITTNATFVPKDIVNVDEVIIINENSTYHRNNFKPQNKKIKLSSNQTAQIMPMQNDTNIPLLSNNINNKNEVLIKSNDIPCTKITHKNTLIGKTLFKDLIGYNNVVLAKRNSIVTIELIQLAKRYNVLNTLTHSVV